MKFREQIGDWLAGLGQRLAKRTLSPGFKGGEISRLTADWNPFASTSLDFELRIALRLMRQRSRDLFRNDGYARKYGSLCSTNIVGPQGIALQVTATDSQGNPNTLLSSRVESKWDAWGKKKNASVSTRHSWLEIQRLVVTTLVRDGEVLIHKRNTGNEFGFALKVLSADWLDETYSRLLSNGNRVIMGVEVDPDDRPVAYWLRQPVYDLWFSQIQKPYYERIDAQDMLHVFLQEDPRQTRGYPWLFSAMFRLKQLGAYEEAELIASRISASKMGFYKKSNELGGNESEEIRLTETVEPGIFQELPPGMEVQTFDTQHPNTQYGFFVKSCLRGIAAGLGVSYNGLAEDLEGVNYSSLRAGLLGERDNWRVLQKWLIENLHEEIYPVWLENALLSGQLNLSGREFSQITQPKWTPRGFAWVDPLKDMAANETALKLGLTSWSKLAQEQGDDFEEILKQRQHDRELAARYGDDLTTLFNPKSPGGNHADQPPPTDDTTGDTNQENSVAM